MAVVHSGLGFQELCMNRFKIVNRGERRETSDRVELPSAFFVIQARVCRSSCLEHKGRPPIAYLQQFAMWHLFLLEQDANQLMSIYFGITAAVLHTPFRDVALEENTPHKGEHLRWKSPEIIQWRLGLFTSR